jgi:hypothetical protein
MKPAIKPISKITYLQLLLLHVVIAFVVFTFRFTGKFILFAAIVYFMYRIFVNGNKKDEVLLAAGYITGFEVFSRMTGGAFSYEFAKYAVIGFLLIGMFFKGFTRKSWPYLFFIIFLVPGILFSAINLNYETSFGNALGFNLSGPVCLAISALYCYDRKVPFQRLQEILLAVLLPIITITTYLFLYTPSIRDVLSGTQSNFAASGGFGPNQVATVLGLGMFILFSRLLVVKSKFINILDLIMLALISYRAIVTFSRGGVYVAGICAVTFIAIYFLRAPGKEKTMLIPKILSIGAVIVITWLYSSVSTMGLIDKRYANQDAAGREKKDFTTGRTDLINRELEAFYQYPITGVGVGKTKEFRMEITGYETATHNEMTRMLSEHGVFGIAALLILMITPMVFRIRNKTNLYLYSFVIFWLLTINHSSMRIAAPAFIYGLCLITILNEKKNTIHRKQIG